MKEAPSKKLPPKLPSGIAPTSSTTPIKNANEEIISTLLRINNCDSISSIKDESLDIDLSACVTISTDPSSILNGNSLSSTDFWRMLDESAQNSQLDLTNISDESSSTIAHDNIDIQTITTKMSAQAALTLTSASPSSLQMSNSPPTDNKKSVQDKNYTFSQFLRPEPPSQQFSPLKKIVKSSPIEQERHRYKIKIPKSSAMNVFNMTENKMTAINSKNIKQLNCVIKTEPPDHIQVDDSAVTAEANTEDVKVDNAKFDELISKSANSFSIFMLPKASNSTLPENQNIDTTINQQTPNVIEILFKCVDCNGLIVSQEDLKKHELAAHRIIYKCSECDRDFEQEAGLKKHWKTHRSLDARKDSWRKCPDCGKCLKLGSMWMHRKIHSDNKKYECDICGQKFVQKINLTHHSRVHVDEKPYECPECQKRFQERSHLQRHQKYHAQTRSYRCDKCGKMYKTERCLKVHNLVHLEQRPFACNVCNKSFISNSKLKQHSNIHTGLRPFKCNYCPRDFTNFPNWLKHTRRRHKVDHKTGEHLENIPSYCSKKSTKTPKTPKTPKTTESKPIQTNEVQNNQTEIIVNNETIPITTPVIATAAEATKAPVKRRKKITHVKPTNETVTTQTGNILPTSAPSNIVLNETNKIPAKAKRERKQLMPKQVQQKLNKNAMTMPPILPSLVSIKKEDSEDCSTLANKNGCFTELHCLSITSAEELIMEQALEMEECGLYDTPVSAVGTDNAISSETAAELHFKIKQEFIQDEIIKEEYITKENRLLCSSLESSPFSSPASIELPSSTSLTITNGDLIKSTGISKANELRVPDNTTPYYLSPFAINQQNSLMTGTEPTLMQQLSTLTTNMEQSQQNQQQQLSTTSIMNQMYMNINLSPQITIQPKPMLPSVDTLLFSAHLQSKTITQQKLS